MKRKRTLYIVIISLLIFTLCIWQYQKHINNKISMSETLQEIDSIIKKENSEVFKILVDDIAKNKRYSIHNIEEFTSIFDNLDETILNTNKKGIIKTDYDYTLLFYFGDYNEDSNEYTENGRISLDVSLKEEDAMRLLMFDGVSKVELNGRLEKSSKSFVNPFTDYIIEGINNNEFSHLE